MQMKLLILDLDETLVFASEARWPHTENFRVGNYFVYTRPDLDKFIGFALEHFKVAVWTSAGSEYANEVLGRIFPAHVHLEFVWASERCTWRYDHELQKRYSVKDLKNVHRLGYALESVLIVDDTPRKVERSYGNHIYVTPFEGDPADTELRKLESYLLWLKDLPNMRLVEKRNWRS
jgi:TFIIF-interacting CTD phosphatase-like protein